MDVLEDARSSRPAGAERTAIERAAEIVREDTPYEVYVTSFSARRDLLSQWRGYGSADGRFCIGFQLSQFSERDVLRIPRRVEYSTERQREQVRRVIDAACGAAAEASDDPARAWSCATSLGFHLRRIMFSFKHIGFQEEEEWRSVATALELDGAKSISFESVRGVPRPFITMLAGSRMSTHLPVVEVCIGHTERKKATVHATRLLLDHYGYSNATITETEIPFSG